MHFASMFGWGSRVPLTATVIPGGGSGTKLVSRSVLDFGSNSLLLVFARPVWNGKGVILCIRETDGKPTSLNVSDLVRSDPSMQVCEVISLDGPIRPVSGSVRFRPYQVRFLMLKAGRR